MCQLKLCATSQQWLVYILYIDYSSPVKTNGAIYHYACVIFMLFNIPVAINIKVSQCYDAK